MTSLFIGIAVAICCIDTLIKNFLVYWRKGFRAGWEHMWAVFPGDARFHEKK